MIRRIIEIDSDKCNGCGLCAKACHEGAIRMVDGKARLIRDDYCDGLGDCLPACPANAISFVEREALAYDEEAVKKNKEKMKQKAFSGCPGSLARTLSRPVSAQEAGSASHMESQLRQWPVQIRLAPVQAPYFDQANLLIAADCSAYAYGSFHQKFMTGKVTLIGCPKLDQTDYSEKLTEIIRQNDIQSITVVRMEVPCCGGIRNAVIKALQNSGKILPWKVVTLSTDGRILEDL